MHTHQPGDYADDTETVREDKNQKHSEWFNRSLAIIAALASFSVGTLVYLRDADLRRFDAQCQAVQQDIKEIRATDESVRGRVDHLSGIVSANSTLLGRLASDTALATTSLFSITSDVQRLLGDAQARPDAFTGRMAEALERSLRQDIGRLEKNVDKLTERHYGPNDKH